jgi:endonuclease YncB( thermonuclease family)
VPTPHRWRHHDRPWARALHQDPVAIDTHRTDQEGRVRVEVTTDGKTITVMDVQLGK